MKDSRIFHEAWRSLLIRKDCTSNHGDSFPSSGFSNHSAKQKFAGAQHSSWRQAKALKPPWLAWVLQIYNVSNAFTLRQITFIVTVYIIGSQTTCSGGKIGLSSSQQLVAMASSDINNFSSSSPRMYCYDHGLSPELRIARPPSYGLRLPSAPKYCLYPKTANLNWIEEA